MNKVSIEKLELVRARTGKPLKDLDIDPNILVRIRKGKPLRASTVFKLAKAFGCEVDEIIDIGGDA